MNITNYPNVEKLAKMFDWALGVVYLLVKFSLWLLLMLFILVSII